MYIEYETAQYCWNMDVKKDKRIPNNLPKPAFMPSKLVRISDLTVVNGSKVHEGYCALSYSWNQSGEIVRDKATGKYKRIDEGKHKIIYNNLTKNVLHYILQKDMKDKIKYVKFEGIIQQICQQFNIKYLWYDQMCINQEDKEEKQREISNIHHIYSNAYCTVALVPEFHFSRSIGYNNEEYFKRLWTLEESIKSERLLFVGKDLHQWGDGKKLSYIVNVLSKPVSELKVSQILYHAHQRKSTKEHDRVFALIHLFPDILPLIKIDYDQPFEELMIQFYGHLATKDISILFFQKIGFGYNSTIQQFNFLPSWTGVNGEYLIIDYVTTTFNNYDIVGKTMRVTSKFLTNDHLIDDDALTTRKNDLPLPPDNINVGDNDKQYCLCVIVNFPGACETKIIRIGDNYCYKDVFEGIPSFDSMSRTLKKYSRFMEIKKKNLRWYHVNSDEYRMAPTILHWLTDDVCDSYSQYMILSEIIFKCDEEDIFYYPVIKKPQKEKYYEVIGCCKVYCKKNIFSDCNLPKQTFLIQ